MGIRHIRDSPFFAANCLARTEEVSHDVIPVASTLHNLDLENVDASRDTGVAIGTAELCVEYESADFFECQESD